MSSPTQLNDLLALKRPAVAVKFQDTAPDGVPKIDKAAVSACTYWKLAAEGRTFYTEAADHYGCPVGSYTHGIDLPEDEAKELEGLVGTMVELQYITMEEVPGIPRVEGTFGVAVYAPLTDANFEADAILVSGNARQMMLLAEAAHAAGIGSDSSVVGRPTCAAIPAVMKSGLTATNLGCIGNRVYTELADDELYFIIADSQLDRIVEKLAVITNANRELEKFHSARVRA
jgi:uncharacterized protein (DUF169 family)